MNEEVEAPNLTDPFEAHAYWVLAFACDGCSAVMEFPEAARQYSRTCFEQMAARAREERWSVADTEGLVWYCDCFVRIL